MRYITVLKDMFSGDNASPGDQSHQTSPKVIFIGKVKVEQKTLKTNDQKGIIKFYEMLSQNHKIMFECVCTQYSTPLKYSYTGTHSDEIMTIEKFFLNKKMQNDL